ncbi:hypothetical protein M9H77_19580 [Catharanthus roseus]|uniref:Uncharacterized protein n=1 Tax=Catharanthus roseus TaxID=4058 RepID=A0ACC0BAU3_CATRO|nr:hypothetical protein M9H77_19580 [Catharanthus roseus]
MAAKAVSNKEDNNNNSSSGSRKTGSAAAVPARPQEQVLKCPRCDSPNTKFCYYNNYSLTQPRHFCKTCRRYWTKGGALRNVPIGGGCRKNKKMKSSSSSRLSGGGGDSKDSSTSSDISGLKFFHGLTPAMDFQIGGINFPRLHHDSSSAVAATAGGHVYNQFSSYGDISSNTSPAIVSTPAGFNLDPSLNSNPLMGFNFPFSSGFNGGINQEMGSVNGNTSLASSIESLSSINQDLHWKLQQQRLAMLYGGENHQQKETDNTIPPQTSFSSLDHHHHQNQIQKPQPMFFHNLEISSSKAEEANGVDDNSRKEGESGTGNLATEWYFGNSYGPVTPTPTNSTGNGNENISSWNGMLSWGNLNQYSPLP